MNTKRTILSLIVVSGLLTASCDDFLDEAPDNRTTIDTKEKVAKLLVSAYPSTSPIYLAELASDNVDDNGSKWSEYNRLQTEAYTWADASEIGTDSPQELWDACYKAIASANLALQSIQELGDTDELKAEKAEALLCRAYGHFVLVNIFSQHYKESSASTDLGIPYITEPETTVAPHYERESVANVYSLINNDIEQALSLVNDDIYTVPKYHFNTKAAYAFATRFNLYYLKYDKVVTYATKVLGSTPSLVLRDWEYAGSLSKNDNYQGDKFISADNPATLLLISAGSLWGRIHGPYSSGSKYCHNSTVSRYETTGSTGTWGVYTNFYNTYASYTSIPKVVVRKINEYFLYTDIVNRIGYANIVHPVFTTDETLLCRAEAFVMKKEYDKATADLGLFQTAFSKTAAPTRGQINTFYANLDYYTPTEPTAKKELNPDFDIEKGSEQENFLHCVLHMRRILTVHEGLRWYDVKRFGIKLYRRIIENGETKVTDELPVNDPRRAMQLPADVIGAGLEPNPR